MSEIVDTLREMERNEALWAGEARKHLEAKHMLEGQLAEAAALVRELRTQARFPEQNTLEGRWALIEKADAWLAAREGKGG